MKNKKVTKIDLELEEQELDAIQATIDMVSKLIALLTINKCDYLITEMDGFEWTLAVEDVEHIENDLKRLKGAKEITN